MMEAARDWVAVVPALPRILPLGDKFWKIACKIVLSGSLKVSDVVVCDDIVMTGSTGKLPRQNALLVLLGSIPLHRLYRNFSEISP